MAPHQVVGREVERERGAQVLPLLGEGVDEPGQAPVLHLEREVLPLDVGRADPLGLKVAVLRKFLDPYYRGWAVPPLFFGPLGAVLFDDDAVVYARPQPAGARSRAAISRQAVS